MPTALEMVALLRIPTSLELRVLLKLGTPPTSDSRRSLFPVTLLTFGTGAGASPEVFSLAATVPALGVAESTLGLSCCALLCKLRFSSYYSSRVVMRPEVHLWGWPTPLLGVDPYDASALYDVIAPCRCRCVPRGGSEVPPTC